MGASQQALVASGGATAGALDSFTTSLWGCYGITRQRSSSVYAGSAIRVRKSTGGDTTTEQDIGLIGTALDTSALATFGGSETVVVTKFYDQSGNSRDLVQATGANQPRIVNAGVYDGFLRFDASNDELRTSGNSGTPTDFTTSFKANLRTNTPTQVLYAAGTGSSTSKAQIYIPSGVNQMDSYTANSGGTSVDNQFTSGVSFPTTAKVFGGIHTMSAVGVVNSARLWRDGTEINKNSTTGATPPTGNFTAQTWRVGSDGGANFAAIDLYSFAIWEANVAASMASIATAMA